MIKKLIKNVFFLFAFLFASSTFANKVISIESKPSRPLINQEMILAFKFEGPNDSVKCGIQIDWGDGKNTKLRFGSAGDVKPPFEVKHTYSTAGKAQVSIQGVTIFRGLNSIGGCEANFNGAVTIVDPVEEARIAKIKIEAEEQRQKKRDQLISLIKNPNVLLTEKLVGSCFIIDSEEYTRLTGGAPFDSCDEKLIKRRFKRGLYGIVILVKFTTDKQLYSTTLSGGVDNSDAPKAISYMTEGNFLMADYQGRGCFKTEEVEVEVDRITLSNTRISGSCSDTEKMLAERLKSSKSTYVLIRP